MGAPLNPVPRAEITPRATLTAPWQAWFNQLYTFVAMPPASGGGVTPATRKINTTYPITGGGALSSDLTLALAAGGISNGFLAQMAAQTLKGNVNGTAATPQDLTGTQVTSLLSLFTSTLQGVVPASGGGTVDFLRADGTWSVPAYPSGANPTSLVGLSAINGSASTFMRSDAAPALNQAIAPTWTGIHTFDNQVNVSYTSGANALTVAGGVGATQAVINSNNAALPNYDWLITRTTSTAGTVIEGPNLTLNDTGANTFTALQHSGGQTELWQFNTAWHQILQVSATRSVTINAPASGNTVNVSNVAGSYILNLTSGSGTSTAVDVFLGRNTSLANNIAAGPCYQLQDNGATTATMFQHSGGQTELWQYNGAWTQILRVLTSGRLQIIGTLGIWNTSPPAAQSTGWGTPTGGVIFNSFGGGSATAAQCAQAIAAIITVLKSYGIVGA